MPHWKRYLLLGLAGIISLYLLLHLLVNIFGKPLLTHKLEASLGKKVTMRSLGTFFPAGIVIKGFDIEDICKIDEITAAGGLFDIFRGNVSLVMLKLTRPTFTWHKNVSPVAEEAPVATEQSASPVALVPQEKEEFFLPPISISRLIITDGALDFIDHSVSKDGLKIRLDHVNLKITNLNLSDWASHRTDFQFQGSLPWQAGQEKGSVDLKGWIDFSQRNMQASLKIEKIDGIYLYPYYSAWVDLEKARIEKAHLNFSSDIKATDNKGVALCHLELTDIVRKPLPEGEAEQEAAKMTNVVLDVFKALDQGKITLDFSIPFRMDRPEFGFRNIQMAFESKFNKAHPGKVKPQHVLILPVNLLQGMVKGAVDLTKSVFHGTVAMGRQIKKSAEDTFYKAPQPPAAVQK